MNQGEFLPDREADNDTLIGLIDLVMRQVEEVERSTGAFGIFTKFISEEELITVQFRPTPASRPAILDRLRLIELPNVIASFVYERESNTSSDTLLVQWENEEIWITNDNGTLDARKRLYGHDQLNLGALSRMRPEEQSMAWKQFGERVQARRHKQAAVDQEEEQLRLNRVSESDISRILTYLGM